jgi:hypothetical protein
MAKISNLDGECYQGCCNKESLRLAIGPNNQVNIHLNGIDKWKKGSAGQFEQE